jgi:flagellar hook-length control protein FliK
MTIEISSAQPEAKPPAASNAKSTKDSAESAAKSGDDGQSGFLAVLALLDAPVEGVGAQVVLVDPLLGSTPTDIADAKPGDTLDPTAFFAQSLQWTTPEQKMAQGIATKTIAADASSAAARALLCLQDAAQPDLTRKSAKLGADTGAGQNQAAFGTTLTGLTASSQSSTQTAIDPKALLAAQKVEAMHVAPTAVESAVVTATISVGHEELARDRTIFKPLMVEATAPIPSTPMAATPATASLTGPAGQALQPEAYVAEQVKYWISNDVQSAELKLDGIGNTPVEVSISMQGNEAHVAFRTDESQARDALENASEHLKELLQREGLVLSGVSVGTADAGASDSAAQERKSRQSAKTATIISEQPVLKPLGAVSGRVSARALDLFV